MLKVHKRKQNQNYKLVNTRLEPNSIIKTNTLKKSKNIPIEHISQANTYAR